LRPQIASLIPSRARFFLLTTYPHVGRRRDEDLRPGLRSFPVGEYVIIYRVAGDDVLILRVIRGSRDIAALLRLMLLSIGVSRGMGDKQCRSHGHWKVGLADLIPSLGKVEKRWAGNQRDKLFT